VPAPSQSWWPPRSDAVGRFPRVRGRSKASARLSQRSSAWRLGRPSTRPCADRALKLGLISDTHGLLRPEVVDEFAGVDHIVHAGDVGSDAVLAELEALAPVTAVRGNVDAGLRRRLPETAELELSGFCVAVIHGNQLSRRSATVAAARFPDASLVVFGHSHLPVVERVGQTLAVNPGSAGRPRFGSPATVALADLRDGNVAARILELR
jgi:uncharacterized protein